MIIMIFFLHILITSNILLGMDNQQEISTEKSDRYQRNPPPKEPYQESKVFITWSPGYGPNIPRQQLWKKFKQFLCCCCIKNEEK